MSARHRLATVQDVDDARRRGDRLILMVLVCVASLFAAGSVSMLIADRDRDQQARAMCEWARAAASRDAAVAAAQVQWGLEVARAWGSAGDLRAARVVREAVVREQSEGAWRTRAAGMDCASPRQAIDKLIRED